MTNQPELASFVICLLSVFPAIFLISRSNLWLRTVGIFLAFECSIGFLLGIDLWSIGKMLF